MNIAPKTTGNKKHGFALIVAISLMSFILLLLLGMSALVQVESANSNQMLQMSKAQANATFGMQVALAQLQKYTAPDQVATAPATLYYSDVSATDWDGQKAGFQSWVANAAATEGRIMTYGATRMTESERNGTDPNNPAPGNFVAASTTFWDNKHPHWVGVWEGKTRDTNGDYTRNQEPVWLVSGYDPLAPTNVSPLTPATTDYVTMVGEGSAIDTTDPTYTADPDELNGIVRVPKVTMAKSGTQTVGAYAYFVSDESQKLNVGLVDHYESTALTDLEYNRRLYAPQRSGFEALSGIDEQFADTPWDINNLRFEDVLANDDIRLVESTLTEDVLRKNFHNLTSISNGLFTDAARGGLRKDLTYYLQTGNGLNDNDPIADPALYVDVNNPSSHDPRIGDINGGFPRSITNIPTWGQLKHWSDNTSDGSGDPVDVTVDTAPLLMNFRLFYGMSRQGTAIYAHFLPIVAMWNPYDVPLDNADYKVSMDLRFNLDRVRVVSRDTPEAIPADNDTRDGLLLGKDLYHRLANPAHMHNSDFKELYVDALTGIPQVDSKTGKTLPPTYEYAPYPATSDIDFTFSTAFEAGEILVFTPATADDINIQNGAPSSYEIALENQFVSSGPAPIRVHVLDIVGGTIGNDVRIYQLDSDDMLLPNGDYDVLFSATATSSAGTFDILDKSVYGTIEPWSMSISLSLDPKPSNQSTTTVWQTNTWKELPVTADFDTGIIVANQAENSRQTDSPIAVIANFALQPFTSTRGKWGNFSIHSQAFFETSSRVFANFNLSAKMLSTHPDVDIKRDIRTSYNNDGFTKYALFGVVPSVDVNNNDIPWDHNSATLPDDGSLSPAWGYSLVANQHSPENRFDERTHMPLRTVKREDTDILSLAQFNQANLSQFFWQPISAVGNSEANPYVSRQYISGLHYDLYTSSKAAGNTFGQVLNDSQNKTIDIAYLLNDALWDGYFLSSVPENDSEIDLDEVISEVAFLPNARYRVRSDVTATKAELRDLDTPAYYLYNQGAFNVNTTSVDAWKSLLSAFRDLKVEGLTRAGAANENPDGTTPIARTIDPLGDRVSFVQDFPVPTSYAAVAGSNGTAPLKDYYDVLAGFRYLTDEMIEVLAERIVDEVKFRGPFYSLSDFVNRRLVAPNDNNDSWTDARQSQDSSVSGWLTGSISDDYDATEGLSGINGAIQRAINLSGINGGDNYSQTLITASPSAYDNDWVYRSRDTVDDNNGRASFFGQQCWYLDTEHLAGVPAGEAGLLLSHSPGFVTQADILSMIGSALTTRGDTFKIRSYGEVVNPLTNTVEAKAWLETVVQRIPDPVTDHPTNPDFEPDDDLGRQYKIVSTRWLTEEEV